jgi:hypothetical protein
MPTSSLRKMLRPRRRVYLKVVNRFRNEPEADEALYQIGLVYYANFSYETPSPFSKLARDNASDLYDDDALYQEGLIYYEQGY